MSARYQTLARRIQLEIEELERTQAVIQRYWQTAVSETSTPPTLTPTGWRISLLASQPSGHKSVRN